MCVTMVTDIAMTLAMVRAGTVGSVLTSACHYQPQSFFFAFWKTWSYLFLNQRSPTCLCELKLHSFEQMTHLCFK